MSLTNSEFYFFSSDTLTLTITYLYIDQTKFKMSSNKKELNQLFSKLQSDINAEKLYWLRNDAKLRAVVSSKSYDEFRYVFFTMLKAICFITFIYRQYVDAAHLKGLSKNDCKKRAQVCWNKKV